MHWGLQLVVTVQNTLVQLVLPHYLISHGAYQGVKEQAGKCRTAVTAAGQGCSENSACQR